MKTKANEKYFFTAATIILVVISCGCLGTNNDFNDTNSLPTTTVSASTTTTSEPYLYFHFLENISNCSISGNLTLNNNSFGKAENGIRKVKLSEFVRNGKNLDQICVLGRITNCKGDYNNWKTYDCWEINISNGYFRQKIGDVLSFMTTVNTHQPKSYEELLNYVRPDDVKDFISHQQEIGFFTNNTVDDVDKLWKYVDSHVSYRYDSDTSGGEYWKLPNETLVQGWGDCDDWSNLFVSLVKAYDYSLKCYSIRLPDHLGAFCKINNSGTMTYGFFDQNTKIKRFSSQGNDESLIRETMNSYFSEYGLTRDESQIINSFDDRQYFIFGSNDDFVSWAKELQP
jgi:hypothetical protein